MRAWIQYTVKVLFTMTVTVFIFVSLNRYVIQAFQVAGESMEPTLFEGDRHWVWKLGEIERFDLVVFPDPDGSGAYYVKRVIGLPGESLEYHDNLMWIDGQVYQDERTDFDTKDFTLLNTLGVEQIPEGNYFVLGDNRAHSRDSREFGTIHRDQILGKVIQRPRKDESIVTSNSLVSWPHGQGQTSGN